RGYHPKVFPAVLQQFAYIVGVDGIFGRVVNVMRKGLRFTVEYVKTGRQGTHEQTVLVVFRYRAYPVFRNASRRGIGVFIMGKSFAVVTIQTAKISTYP